MAVPARTKVRDLHILMMSACRSQFEELLGDPEVDVVYIPVSRMFLNFE
jgi:hypothetical protein